jgi:hypothetical protein
MATTFFIASKKTYDSEEEAQEDLGTLLKEHDLPPDVLLVVEMKTFDS